MPMTPSASVTIQRQPVRPPHLALYALSCNSLSWARLCLARRNSASDSTPLLVPLPLSTRAPPDASSVKCNPLEPDGPKYTPAADLLVAPEHDSAELSTSPEHAPGGSSTAAIAGWVIGGAAALLLVTLCACYALQRRGSTYAPFEECAATAAGGVAAPPPALSRRCARALPDLDAPVLPERGAAAPAGRGAPPPPPSPRSSTAGSPMLPGRGAWHGPDGSPPLSSGCTPPPHCDSVIGSF
jgi:hypothetical protein